MSKIVRKIAMSKPVGKVLDSKVAKKVMIPVGKAVIKAVKAPGKAIVAGIKKEQAYEKFKDAKYRKEAPEGAYGK